MANCRKYQAEIRDLKHAIEEMRKEQENLRDVLSQTERRVLAASNEAEEARGLHDMAERQKRQLDNELTSVKENLQDSIGQNQSISNAKRSLETEVVTLRSEIEEMSFAMRNSEDKAKNAALDAIRLAEEARIHQDRAEKEESDKKTLEATIKQLQIRLEEAEVNAVRGGRKAIEKLEAKVMHLNAELDMENKFKADLNKKHNKAERKFREMEFQWEEERKSSGRLQELNDHLNEKLRNFKLQVEDAEEIAALNLAKFRRAQTEVEESEQRANLAEQAMGKLRARSAMRSETPF